MLMNRLFSVYEETREENLDGTPGKIVKKLIDNYKCNAHSIDATQIIYNDIVTVKQEPIRIYTNIDIYNKSAKPIIEFEGIEYTIAKQNKVKKPYSYLLAKRGV